MARIEGITIEINGDTKKLATAIKNLNSPINRVQTELKNVEKLLKMDPGNVELLTRKEKALGQAVSDAEKKLKTLEDAQKEVNQTIAEGGEVSESQYAKLQNEIDKTRLQVDKLKEAQRSFGSVSAQHLAAVGEKVENLGNKISEAGNKLTPLSTAAAGITAVGVKSAIDLETAFTGVAKTVEATPQQFEAITKGIEEMSMRTASSVTDIAAVAEAAGQLGIATDDVLEFTETMVMLGDTTNLTAEEAASALAKFANITGTTADNYGRLGAVIVDLGNNFATTEADIVAMATRLAATGSQVGLTESEIMALATAMSSVGIEAEAGGTAMTQTFAAIEKAVANGGDKLQQFAQIAGISADEFATMWQTKPIDAIAAFINGLGELEGKGESATLVLDEMGLSGIRQSNMLKSLGNASDVLTEAIDTANMAWGENAALTEEAQKKYETAATTLTQLKNALVIAAGNMGEVLLPVLKTVAEKTTEAVKSFQEMPEPVKKAAVVLLALISAVAPVLLMFGKLATAAGQTMKVAPQIASAFAKIIPILSTLGTVFAGVFGAVKSTVGAIKSLLPVVGTALTTPVGIAVVAITGLITAFTLLWKNCESFRNFFINAFNSIKSAVVPIIENIKTAISLLWTDSIMPVLQNIGSQLMPIIQNIFGQFSATFQACTPMIKGICDSFTDIFATLVESGGKIAESLIPLFEALFSSVMPVIEALFSSVMPVIETLIGAVSEAIQAIILPIIQTIITVIAVVVAAILPVIQAVIEAILPIIETAISLISTIIQTITPIIVELINFIVPIITAAIDTITEIIEAVTPVIQSIVDFITPIIENVATAIAGVLGGITLVLQGIINFVKGVFTGNWKQAWEGVKQIFQGVLSVIKSLFTGFSNTVKSIVDGIKGVFTAAGNAIKNVFFAVGSAISGALTKAAGVVKSALTAAANGIKSVWSGITGFFKGIASKILGVFQSLPSQMVSIGKNIVQGIINGVTGAAGKLVSSIKSLGDKVVGMAKSVFKINSPSKIMRDIVGEGIVEGIAVGIEKNSDMATDAMKKVSQDILTEAEDILEKQKKFGEISAEQELEYWRQVKNIKGLQGDEIIAIEEKILEQEKSISDQAQQEYEQRITELVGFANIFDEFENKTVYGEDLISGLTSQVNALEEYGNLMEQLISRGISSALIEELRNQGVNAVNEIRALARMSDEELAHYDALYAKKMQLATGQAALELGNAATSVISDVNQAVTALNENASLVVNQASEEQSTLLENISNKTAEYVGQALLDGLAAIQQTILESMPDYLQINVDGTQIARTTWNPFDKEGDRRNRLYAPSRQQIAEIAAQVYASMAGTSA